MFVFCNDGWRIKFSLFSLFCPQRRSHHFGHIEATSLTCKGIEIRYFRYFGLILALYIGTSSPPFLKPFHTIIKLNKMPEDIIYYDLQRMIAVQVTEDIYRLQLHARWFRKNGKTKQYSELVTEIKDFRFKGREMEFGGKALGISLGNIFGFSCSLGLMHMAYLLYNRNRIPWLKLGKRLLILKLIPLLLPQLWDQIWQLF